MRSAVIFYSYSGNTKKVALELNKYLGERGSVELIEIKGLDESGNFFKQSNRAFFQKEAIIQGAKLDLSSFDMICLGTPVWAFGPAPAMNTYLKECSGLQGKNMIIFTTHGSGLGVGRCVKIIEDAVTKKGANKTRNFSIQQAKVNDAEFLLDTFSKIF